MLLFIYDDAVFRKSSWGPYLVFIQIVRKPTDKYFMRTVWNDGAHPRRSS